MSPFAAGILGASALSCLSVVIMVAILGFGLSPLCWIAAAAALVPALIFVLA